VDVGVVASVVGDVLAALAVVVATVQLRRASELEKRAAQSTRTERRVSYYLGILVEIADKLGHFGKSPEDAIVVRVRLLRPEALPTARQWIDDWDGLFAKFSTEVLPNYPDGFDFGGWVRGTILTEIERETAALLTLESDSLNP